MRSLKEIIDNYLIPYEEEHGNLLIPSLYKASDGYHLGEWVKMRRIYKRKGELSDLEVAMLDEIGFVWDARGLSTWKHAARRFHRRHGHLDVPQAYVSPDGVPLGKRINGARNSLRYGDLKPETKNFLDGLDPRWASVDRRKFVEKCSVSGCTRVYYARDWCRKHYNNWHQYGNPIPPNLRVLEYSPERVDPSIAAIPT